MSRNPTIKDRVEFAGLHGVLRWLQGRSLPRARLWGIRLAKLMMRVAPIRRDLALANIHAAFPQMNPAQAKTVYEGMMRNLGRMLGDFAHLPRHTSEDVLELCALEGREHLESLAAQGKGGVLLTGHYGNWELLGASACAVGLPIVFLGARQRNPQVEALFNGYRKSVGGEAVSLGDGLRPLVKHLKAGRVLATLADQDGGKDGMFLEFLGRKASVRPGVFRLMARLDVPMVTGFCWWEKVTWKAKVEAPVYPSSFPGDVDARARGLAALYNQRLEEYVRERPDHWFWVHHRWRSRPRKHSD